MKKETKTSKEAKVKKIVKPKKEKEEITNGIQGKTEAEKVEEPKVEIKQEISHELSKELLLSLVVKARQQLPEKAEKFVNQFSDAVLNKEYTHYYRYLFALSNHLKPKVIVEIGTWKGISALCLALGNPKAKILTVDLNDYKQKGVEEQNVKYCFGSLPTIYESIDLLFIDGEHTFDFCNRETNAYLSRMSNTSIILYDDINLNDEMKAFWQELVIPNGEKVTLPIHGEAGFGAVIIKK